MVRIVALTRQGQKFTWRELWWGSLWGLGALRGWSLPTSALFYLGVLPLAGFGYVNSLLPTLSVPEFIFSELRRYGSLGMAAMILLPALGYLLAAALVFVPLSMALGRRTFIQATRESLLTDEERGENESPPPPVEEAPPAPEQPAPCPQVPGLEPGYVQLLLALLRGEPTAPLVQAHKWMPSVVADAINQAFFDDIGDNILECDGAAITLVEDYREEILEMLGGMNP